MHNGGSDGKETAYNARDLGWIPGSGRSPGEENDNPLQYSCLENSMDRGAWWAIVPGIVESDATEQLLYTHTHIHSCYQYSNQDIKWFHPPRKFSASDF